MGPSRPGKPSTNHSNVYEGPQPIRSVASVLGSMVGRTVNARQRRHTPAHHKCPPKQGLGVGFCHTTALPYPTPVNGFPRSHSGIKAVSVATGGWRNSMAMGKDGTVWTAGWNGRGVIGDGTEAGLDALPKNLKQNFVKAKDTTDGYING